MGGVANRGVKGADPITREIAERMARQSGLSLEDWLTSLRTFDAGGEARPDLAPRAEAGTAYVQTSRAGETAPPRIEAAGHPADEMARMTHAIERLSQRIEGTGDRTVSLPQERPDRPADEVTRMTLAIERLSERIEAAEDRTGAAIGEVEQTVRAAIYRLDGTDRERIAVAARFEGAVQEIGAEQARIAERLERMEKEAHGPRSVEALRALEGALARVAGRLYEGEASMREAMAELGSRVDGLQAQEGQSVAMAERVVGQIGARLEESEGRTREALSRLQAAFSALDSRMASVEGEIAGGGVDARLEQLADTLSARLDAARADMDLRFRTMAEGRVDQIERALGQMSDQMQTAERRSAEAFERMGREVSDIAGALTRRVQESETRGAKAIEQVGGDVARIAQAVETKLGRADTIQAQALEKLGGEIARISERLAERIASSDRRAAMAIDEVGEQVARTSERFSQRQERVSEELAERIRLSEERTARVLEEARERLERLSFARQAETALRPAPATDGQDGPEGPIYGDDPFIDFQSPPAAFAAPGEAPQAEPAAVADDIPTADEASTEQPPHDDSFAQRIAASWSADPGPAVDLDDGFAAQTAALEPVAAVEPVTEQAVSAAPIETYASSASTWEIVQRTRAATAASHAAAAAPNLDRTTISNDDEGGLFSRRFTVRRPQGGGGVALGVGMAAAVGLAMGGFWYLEGGFRPLSLAAAPAPGPRAITAPSTAMPQEAVALSAAPPTSADTDLPRSAASSPDLALRYSAAVARVAADPKQGLESLRVVANLGYAPAQFYLAKLYEAGADGLKKDPTEARRWTERAAEGGERKAMHNLALYYFEGTGGPKDVAQAAEWFRKAAELGLADSQFNLARMYEQGLGLPRNAAEAYKWYTIAGRSGDAESRAGAARLAATLSPEARRAAERSAVGYRGAVQADATTTQAPAGDLATAQKALLALGYYQGPADGAPSPALRLALSAYQQDQGLPPSGVPDAATMGKLSGSAR